MSPRAGLSAPAVVDAALAVVDELGADRLSLARIAERTGVATPSLYKHVDGLPALRRLVTLRVLAEFTETVRDAVVGRSGADGVRALMHAYRDYIRSYPHRSVFVEPAPAPGDVEAQAAGAAAVGVLFAVLRGYGLDGPAAVPAARCLRSAVHGFSSLEANGGFGLPVDIDASFDDLVTMVTAGLAAMTTR